MAGLAPAPIPAPIPAGQQFAAIANLRWCLFRNGFRRKGGKGELAARIIAYPIAFLFLMGPVAGSFFAAYFAATQQNLAVLGLVFAAIFGLQLIVSINISPPGLSFDPESLIRYPLTFPRYLVVRLFLGLLSASTIVGTLCLFAAAAGVTVVKPLLAPVAFAAALSLALCNMLFLRMVFAWIDRWLSTRRARELFTVLIFVFSIGMQYLNVTFNNVGHRSSPAQQRAKLDAAVNFYHHAQPYLAGLPSGLAASAILRASQPNSAAAALAGIAGVLVYAGLFLAVFAWRMGREYRGENLSEGSVHNATATKPSSATARTNLEVPRPRPARANPTASSTAPPHLSPLIAACLRKEWIYVRRNPAQFYGLIAPLAMVFLFAGRMGSFSRTGMIFPAAAAYSLLGIAAVAYNVLGTDGPGVQFYFLAPVPIRTVMLAKNLFGFTITAVQLSLLYLLLTFTSGRPPFLIALSTVLWIIFAALVNAAVGNLRSIIAPKKVDPSKISRKQASQLSALMSLGIMLGVAALGAICLALSRFLHRPWLPIPIFLALALAAFVLYQVGLDRLDSTALNHRETLIEELSKVSA